MKKQWIQESNKRNNKEKLLGLIKEWKDSGGLQSMFDEMCNSPQSFSIVGKQFNISGNVVKSLIEKAL